MNLGTHGTAVQRYVPVRTGLYQNRELLMSTLPVVTCLLQLETFCNQSGLDRLGYKHRMGLIRLPISRYFIRYSNPLAGQAWIWFYSNSGLVHRFVHTLMSVWRKSATRVFSISYDMQKSYRTSFEKRKVSIRHFQEPYPGGLKFLGSCNLSIDIREA